MLMKKLAVAILATFVFVGCKSPTQEQCSSAVRTYNAYLNLVEKGEYISPEQIRQARLAVDILQINCGWLPVAKHRVFTAQDDNGVLLIAKPR